MERLASMHWQSPPPTSVDEELAAYDDGTAWLVVRCPRDGTATIGTWSTTPEVDDHAALVAAGDIVWCASSCTSTRISTMVFGSWPHVLVDPRPTTSGKRYGSTCGLHRIRRLAAPTRCSSSSACGRRGRPDRCGPPPRRVPVWSRALCVSERSARTQARGSGGSRLLYVDTGAFVALLYERDDAHARVSAHLRTLRASDARLLTSEPVISETVTRLRYDAGLPPVTAFRDLLHRATAPGSLTIRDSDEQLRARHSRHWSSSRT